MLGFQDFNKTQINSSGLTSFSGYATKFASGAVLVKIWVKNRSGLCSHMQCIQKTEVKFSGVLCMCEYKCSKGLCGYVRTGFGTTSLDILVLTGAWSFSRIHYVRFMVLLLSPCDSANSSLRPPATSVATMMMTTLQTRPVLHSISMVTTVFAIVTELSAVVPGRLSQHVFCPLGCPSA